MPVLQTLFMLTLEASTLGVFIDRWANQPENTISQFLYEDTAYRILFTFYTLKHITLLFWGAKGQVQPIALVLAGLGWIWLIICTNHGSRLLHILGAAVYIVFIFVFAYAHSTDYPWAVKIAIQLTTTATVILAIVFAYFESHRSHVTYILEHSLFAMCQVMYSFFTHIPPERLA